jgi:hypothetical protein
MPISKKICAMALPFRNGLLICSFNSQPKAYLLSFTYAYGRLLTEMQLEKIRSTSRRAWVDFEISTSWFRPRAGGEL